MAMAIETFENLGELKCTDRMCIVQIPWTPDLDLAIG